MDRNGTKRKYKGRSQTQLRKKNKKHGQITAISEQEGNKALYPPRKLPAKHPQIKLTEGLQNKSSTDLVSSKHQLCIYVTPLLGSWPPPGSSKRCVCVCTSYRGGCYQRGCDERRLASCGDCRKPPFTCAQHYH